MKKAFTMVELLAVIIVLGIIVAIAYPVITNVITNSRLKAYIADEDSMEEAARRYFIDSNDVASVPLGEYTILTLEELVNSGEMHPIIDYATENQCNLTTSYVVVTNDTNKGYLFDAVLDCDSYNTLLAQGEWTPWQEEEIIESPGYVVETTTGYNVDFVTEETDDWSHWYFDDPPEAANNLMKVATTYELIDTEYEYDIVYKYFDTKWKWYTNTIAYYPDDTDQAGGTYASEAPSGYETKDTTQTTITDWSAWSTANPTDQTYRTEENRTEYQYRDQQWKWYQYQTKCRSVSYPFCCKYCDGTTCANKGLVSCVSASANRANVLSFGGGIYCYIYYDLAKPSYTYYSGGAWIDGSCPSGYSAYDSRNAYYPSDTTQALGTYVSTAPSGYPTKDTSQTTYTAWSAWSTTNPTDQTYREENTRTTYRYQDQQWKWYTGSTGYYPAMTTQSLGEYSSEAPSGFASKDETQSVVELGVPSVRFDENPAALLYDFSADMPTIKDYREIVTKNITRRRETNRVTTTQLTTGIILDDFLDQFVTDMNSDETVDEADYTLYCAQDGIECKTVTLYRKTSSGN